MKAEESLKMIGIPITPAINNILNKLKEEGHTDTGIGYAVRKAEEKLLMFKNDNRFNGIFINEVNKYAFKKGDERWEQRRGVSK